MTTIQGNDAFLMVKVSGVYKYAGCMQSITFRNTVEDIETTTIDSDTSREYIAGLDSAEGSFNGVASLDDLSKYQYEVFVSDKRLVSDYRVYITDSLSNVFQYDFKAKTQTIELNSQAGSICKFSVGFLVSGTITKIKTSSSGGGVNYLVDGNGDYILDGGGNYIIVP